MDTENANEMRSSAMVASGDGKNEGAEKPMAAGWTGSGQCDPAVLDDLARDFRKIAGKRPDGMVSKKSMTQAIIRELVAVAKFGDPKIWYVRAIVDRGFDRKTAYKIVKEAYRQAEPRWRTEISADRASPGKAGNLAVPAAASPLPSVANPDAAVGSEKPRHQRGHSLWRHYNEMFNGYERFKFKRPQTPADADGLYHESHEEVNRYGQVWAAVGFRMVPEDLPKVLPELKASGLLEVYRVDPAVIQELEETREKMLAAGVDMRLTAPSANSDQVADDPIEDEPNQTRSPS